MDKTLNHEAIREKCEELGLNQNAIATELGLSRAAISKWFNDQSFPRPAELLKLGRLLKLRHSELVNSTLVLEEPLVAFRKRACSKTTDAHISRAKDMGDLLRPLVAYMDFDPFLGPPSLKEPSTNYRYIQDLVTRIRQQIKVGEASPIEFSELIGLFHEYQAVIIPTLWGEKSKHENALHIHLPDSKTTWVYLNLDVNAHDFKFWMAHELGHVMTIDLLESRRFEEAENFADTFAGALLFPEAAVKDAYLNYKSRRVTNGRLEVLCENAESFEISPYSVYLELQRYVEEYDLPFAEIPQELLHKAIARFNRGYKSLSRALFDDQTPTADRFMRIAEESFGTDIYKALGAYAKEHAPSPSLIASLLSVTPMDGHAYHEALSR